jgi:methionyl-tRNA formyltransferase
MKLAIGLLCSGELGLNTVRILSQNFTPQFIFTDKNSDGIIDFATINKIPVFIGNPRKNEPAGFLQKFKTDVIFSVNYLFIVQHNILKHPRLYAINFHGSLLPKYRGRTPHVWAIINGEKETGITAHMMEEGCDTGDIVLQEKLNILEDFTGADILNEFKRIYPEMILELIRQIENNELKPVEQDNSRATYFGKRTPEDGQINWNWQKERIYNWVRAQAHPYPGAFTLLNNQKIIIDKISYSDYGFDNEMPNGLIVKNEPTILVKTPNGAVELTQVRNSETYLIKTNEKFESPCK